MAEDQETDKLLAKMELENGGRLDFRTYALYSGRSGEKSINKGGLLYFVGDRLIFEDFENDSSSMMMMFRKKPKYEKMKFQISVSDIKQTDLVSMSQAIKAIKFGAVPENIKAVKGLRKMVFRNITQVLLKDGSAYYFEIFDTKGFTEFISNKIQ